MHRERVQPPHVLLWLHPFWLLLPLTYPLAPPPSHVPLWLFPHFIIISESQQLSTVLVVTFSITLNICRQLHEDYPSVIKMLQIKTTATIRSEITQFLSDFTTLLLCFHKQTLSEI